ncbi:MAG: tetratricopeptide repeat protein [Pyrinomonadaceae bacterium]|nr:tetratricopeptide repeat protein [Pyrinomonadaceae bacterium]
MNVNAPEPHTYEFDDFRLDAVRRLLLRSGEVVPLTPKVLETLLYFVRNRGRVLGKSELMGALWPDAFVEENNLTQSVSSLRRALGEARGENRYVVTVPGQGYRFAAEVRTIASAVSAASEPPLAQGPMPDPDASASEIERQATGPASTSRENGRKQIVQRILLVGLVVAVLGVPAIYLWRTRALSPTNRQIRTIAVLPFKPLVPEGRDEALELGMADTLVTRLSGIRQVVVSPISAVRRYGGLEQNPLVAGSELGVEAVLDGTIQRSGERIRVTARLTNIADGSTLWAGQFDERFADIFQVQSAISERVASELVPRLTGEERVILAKRYTDDAEAYELYVKGRFFWGKRSREGDKQALECFTQALSRDPNYALAHAGLAEYYRGLPLSKDLPSREAMPKAKEAAEKALQLDEMLAEAHTALGWVKFFYEWDWQGAEREHRRALEINPNLPAAHVAYGNLLSGLGRHEEALAEMDRAHRLDPLSALGGALHGMALYLARRYPEAGEHLRRELEINPNFWLTWIQLGKSYEQMGRYEDALEAFRRADGSGGPAETQSFIGYTYATSGRKREAEQVLRELAARGERSYLAPYNMAVVYQGLGDKDGALRWLERAYDERDPHMVFLGVEPAWDSLRAEPRFADLMKRLRLSG